MNLHNRILISEPNIEDAVSSFFRKEQEKDYENFNARDYIEKFELHLEEYYNTEVHIACLNSGTSAMHLALIQLEVGFGDEVICQSFTFCGSANPIIYQGATPVFVDSELETWNMCPIQLEIAIKDRIKKGKLPKAIIAVHLYGMPAKMEELLEVANKYGIPIIEDAAEAFGSSLNNKKCGTFGKFAVLSFNNNKIITTYGGGALICNNKKSKDHTIYLATQARDDEHFYQHSKIGYNYRINALAAHVGASQLKSIEAYIKNRRDINKFYVNLFENIEGINVFKELYNFRKSNHWLSCIIIDEDKISLTANDIKEALEKDNIESRPLWKPMHLQPVFLDFPYYGTGISDKLFKTGLCLPSGYNLSKDDKNRIASSLLKCIKG